MRATAACLNVHLLLEMHMLTDRVLVVHWMREVPRGRTMLQEFRVGNLMILEFWSGGVAGVFKRMICFHFDNKMK